MRYNSLPMIIGIVLTLAALSVGYGLWGRFTAGVKADLIRVQATTPAKQSRDAAIPTDPVVTVKKLAIESTPIAVAGAPAGLARAYFVSFLCLRPAGVEVHKELLIVEKPGTLESRALGVNTEKRISTGFVSIKLSEDGLIMTVKENDRLHVLGKEGATWGTVSGENSGIFISAVEEPKP